MANGISQVDFVGLQRTSQAQAEAVAAAGAQFQHMTETVYAMASTWQGEAAIRFRQAIEKLRANGDNLLNALGGMSNLMAQTNVGFQQTHDTTVTASNTLSAGVGDVPLTGIPGL